MNNKRLYLLGGAVLVAFAAFTLLSFTKNLTPYVSYRDARAEANQVVQVAGALAEKTSSYDREEEALRFTLEDPESKETLRVRYHGLKPANFEEAISIVAIGRYDRARDEFAADKLLVKCPSKYQGVEVKEYS
jgi:cytochrome c-type biogenesis protein CcmE